MFLNYQLLICKLEIPLLVNDNETVVMCCADTDISHGWLLDNVTYEYHRVRDH